MALNGRLGQRFSQAPQPTLEQIRAASARLDDLPLFAAVAEPAPAPLSSALDDAMAGIDPDELTPREALEALYRLKGLSRS